VNRSLALDVFRGLTVALMILVNNPGTWSHIYAPFEHAAWHGLTPTDLVFPFFLFAVGNAQSLVLPRIWESNTKNYFFKKVWKRTLFIFLIGFFLNWYPFFTWIGDDLKVRTWTWLNVEGVEVGIRILGVLQRIALAYGFSAILEYLFPKKVLTISLGLLALYWGMCVLFGRGDVYSLEGFFGTSVDRLILTPVHLYQGEGVAFDPEGLISTIPAIAQVMLGYWVGRILVAFNPRRTMKALIKRGVNLLILGILISAINPVNKKIWTSSYVLVTTGLAILILAGLVYVLDRKKIGTKFAYFFEAFGKNPLFIFVLSALVPKTMSLIRIPYLDKFLTPLQWFYEMVCSKFPGPPENGSLLYAILLVGLYGTLAIWLDKRKLYIKV
jgi:predicted acyltransferase